MTLNELIKRKDINNFEKVLLIYLQDNSFKSVKDLEPVFEVHEVTLKRALANLRKLELVNKHTPIKIDFLDKGESKESQVIAQKEFTVIIKEK